MSADSRRGLGYFASIDGLRSIAVMSVVLFHLREELLPGGYAGVDIFFVISGFVVTGSLAHASYDRFRDLLAAFYARRLVRILPPLIFCLLVTFLLYITFIPKSLLNNLTERTGIYAFLGLSNFVLARNIDDYFAPVADFNPFLHTWSLGVEEQFYLIFPFLLFLYLKSHGRRFYRRTTLSVIVLAGLVSFILCGVLTAVKWDYGFYLLPARFWQLALGMVLALTFRTWQPRLQGLDARVANGLTGLSLLMMAIAFITPSSPYFPFPLALVPTIAAGLAILLCASRPKDILGRILASRVPLTIGLRSYSLYLWHWPIIVLMRWTTSVDTAPLMIAAIAIAFLMAELSYRFVERPFRQSRRIKAERRSTVAFAGIAVAIAGTLAGYSIAVAQPVISLSKTADVDIWQSRRHSTLLPGPAGCSLGYGKTSVAGGQKDVWSRKGCASAQGVIYAIGNSHAQGYAPALRQFTLDTGHPSILYFKNGCGFLLLHEPLFESQKCGAYLKKATQELEALLRPGDIVLLSTFRLKQPVDQWGKVTPVTADPAKEAAAMAEARTVLARLANTGATLVFEAPRPMMGAPVYRCVDWYTKLNPICSVGLSIPRDEMLSLRRPIVSKMRQLTNENDHVVIWDPLPALCPGLICSAFDHGKPLYFDKHHLSNFGNQVLRPSFHDFMSAHLGDMASEGLGEQGSNRSAGQAR